ncbi:MAG: serine hydrolase, partial [Cyclobacteriaceae bacterium]
YYQVDSTHYFYPASTVKLPQVLLALEKLNELRAMGYSIDKYSPIYHDSLYEGQLSVEIDTTAQDSIPTIANYAKKIMVVSDNDAFNRLYEFVGQKATNEKMRAKGYNIRFLHRLERPLTPDQNRHTEAVRFVRNQTVLYQQPMLVNTDSIRAPRKVFKGKGFIRKDSLIQRPFDFTYKNSYPLQEQQEILKAILFPEAIDAKRRFNLTAEDRHFVMQYMSQWPRETQEPPYHQDTTLYDAYCKFLLYGDDPTPIPSNIRIFNKVGDAYGYLIDNAYIVDFENGVEFMLSAVINTNTDGIYNDGKYEYKTIGYPFMKNLGQVIYDYERKRKRKHKPNLSEFQISR